jgi:Flp pilus assembly protein TadD
VVFWTARRQARHFTYALIGWSLLLLGRFADAEAHIAPLVAATARTASAYPYLLANLASALLMRGRVAEALPCYREAAAFPGMRQAIADDLADFRRRGFPTAGVAEVEALLAR